MAIVTARVSRPGPAAALLLPLLLLLILSFLVSQQYSVANLQHANAGLISRKVLVEKEGNMKGKLFVASELRAVPAGPDPLHHNGGSPKKKPRSTSTP